MSRTAAIIAWVAISATLNLLFDNNLQSWKILFYQAWAVATFNITYHYCWQDRSK